MPASPSPILRLALATSIAACLVAPAALSRAEGPAGPGALARPAPAAPVFATPGGRYDDTTRVAIRARVGSTIRYTLDGSMPTTRSPIYRRPLVVRKNTNVAAIAVRDGPVSEPEVEGYLIRRREPLLSFVVMSDVHTSTLTEANTSWSSTPSRTPVRSASGCSSASPPSPPSRGPARRSSWSVTARSPGP